jgi:hypothetical protein
MDPNIRPYRDHIEEEEEEYENGVGDEEEEDEMVREDNEGGDEEDAAMEMSKDHRKGGHYSNHVQNSYQIPP